MQRSVVTLGPFFLGSSLSLVDAGFVPALQRLAWVNELYPALASFEKRRIAQLSGLVVAPADDVAVNDGARVQQANRHGAGRPLMHQAGVPLML